MSIENLISRSLRTVLAELPEGADIPKSDQFQTLLTGLEVFIPRVIGEIHPEMAGQSGDGVFPIIARKTGDDEVELLGHFCFIADQTLTPLRSYFWRAARVTRQGMQSLAARQAVAAARGR